VNPSFWITESLGHLNWVTTIPHKIDHIVKLQAQRAAAERPRFTHGMSNDDILSSLTSRLNASGGSGGHSDPTATAVLAGYVDDEYETIGSLHHAVELIADSAAKALDLIGHPHPFPISWTILQTALSAQASLILLNEALPPEPSDHVLWLLREPIHGTACWLRETCEAIYTGTRLEDRDQPQQKPLVECVLCSEWRQGTIAASRGRCEQCAKFQDNHKCKPTEAIVRRWEATGSSATPPGMILEARATSRRRAKVG